MKTMMMKQYKNKIKTMPILLGLALSVGLIANYAQAASEFLQEQIRVNSYFRELVQTQMDSLVPKGNYTVDVNISLDQNKLKQLYQSREVSLDLPMAGTFMDSRASSIHQDGAQTLSLEELLSLVNKKSVRIGVTTSVSPVIRNMIKESIEKQLQFSAERGEVVETFDLPKEFSESWVQGFQLSQSKAQDFNLMWIFLGGMILFFGALAAFFFFGIKSLSSKLLTEVSQISKQFSEEKAGASFDFSKEMSAAQNQTKAAASHADVASDTRIFEKMDVETLKLVCNDCVSNPTYKFVPYSLIFHWLDRAMSDALDQSLPENLKPFPTPEDTLPSKAEVSRFLVENYPQYKQLAKSGFSHFVSKFESDQLGYFLETVPLEDAVVVLEKLSPLKKKACIATIPLNKRFELSKVAVQHWDTDKIESKEKALTKSIELFASSPKAKEHAKAHQTKQMLKPEFLSVNSFVDDENLYHMTKNEPGLYEGVLKIIDESDAQFWTKVEVKEIAILTFGYSDAVKASVQAKFSGKRGEWYKSFVENFINSGLTYDHPVVTSVRKEMLDKYGHQTAKTDDTAKAA